MTNSGLWQNIQAILRSSTQERLYTTWVEPASLEEVGDSDIGKVLTIGVPGPMYKDWLATNYMGHLEKAVASQVEAPFKIEFVVKAKVVDEQQVFNLPSSMTVQQAQQSATASETPSLTPPPPRRDIFHPDFTFGTFVVGQANQLAHAACYSVAEKPGKAVNPLFVCGPSGTGKTHLLNAIGNYVRDKHPNLRICYISGERFLNDFVASMRHGQMDKFRQRYRERYDFLIVDDIHIIAGKDATQEEFFYTYNVYHDAGKQVVVASDKLPREMVGLEDRIRSRLEWGLTVDIQPPDFETRLAILRYKAERSGIMVPDDVLNLIANMAKRSVRELEGHLTTIRMHAELRGIPITMELAKMAFASIIQDQKRGLTTEDVLRIVADHFNLTIRDLKSETRVKTIARPRQIAMFLSRKLLGAGYVEIGKAFGNRDHSTIIHGETTIKELMEENPDFKNEVNRLESYINSSQ